MTCYVSLVFAEKIYKCSESLRLALLRSSQPQSNGTYSQRTKVPEEDCVVRHAGFFVHPQRSWLPCFNAVSVSSRIPAAQECPAALQSDRFQDQPRGCVPCAGRKGALQPPTKHELRKDLLRMMFHNKFAEHVSLIPFDRYLSNSID